jgi:hypothetical protein
VEITLRPKTPPADQETESCGRLRRLRQVARRRGLPALAVAALVGLPGTVAARQMVMGDQDGGSNADEDWGASILEPEDADFVEANWERAMDIEPIYDDGLELEDEDMEPLVGALGANGIPEVALDAYYNAEDTLGLDDPDCGVPWSLVAAIGRVESNHGQYGGAQLLEDGYGTKPIRGIPLDGRPGVALIRDTDNGALDDDTTYDRAAGPMQFIPSSWPGVASDGNTDGQKDPDNIYDASIGTGVYLCAGDGDLFEDPDARYAAVFRYNRSDEYVRAVLSLAEMYEEGGVEELPFEEPEFDEAFDDFDADVAAEDALGPELPEPAPAPAPAPVPAPRPAPAPAPSPIPEAPADVPTLPDPPMDPISVGWPQGMNELPPAELPPAPTPPTTVPPTTVPVDPQDPECPAPIDEQAPDQASTATTDTTGPADPTTTDPADLADPDCEPPNGEPATEGAGSAGTDGASADGEDAGSSPAPPDETSAP